MGPSSVRAASRALARGRLVVHPTDTLYALAARATSSAAVERLLAAKGRSAARRLSVAVSSIEELETWGVLTPSARRFVRRFLPGPYTVLVRPSAAARRRLARAVAAGRRIGLRVPDHPIARELARRVGPITSTSANRSGGRAARSLRDARTVLGDAVSVYLDGPPPPSGTPSKLVDLAGARPAPVARR